MKRLRFPLLAVLLVWILAACLPGLGTIQPVQVSAETPHIAVAAAASFKLDGIGKLILDSFVNFVLRRLI